MKKIAIIAVLFALLLLSCKEEQKKEICDSSCEMRKEFELSPARIDFRHIKRDSSELKYKTLPTVGRSRERYPKPFNVSMTRTATGVLVKLKNDARMVEFNMEEWLDFVRALYKSINERTAPIEWSKINDILEIKIYYSNKAEPNEYYDIDNVYGGKIRDVIKDMEAKIKGSLDLIWDSLSLVCDSSCEVRRAKFKSTIIGISLHQSGAAQGGAWYVNKTTTGASAMFRSPTSRSEKTLSMEEWQDFIDVLSKYCINWENEEDRRGGPPWVLRILSSNKNKRIDTLIFEMPRSKPSVNNWTKVKEVIFDVLKKE